MSVIINNKKITSIISKNTSSGLFSYEINKKINKSKTSIQLKNEDWYRFSISSLFLSSQSVLVVSNKEGTSFASYYGKEVPQCSEEINITTPPLKGRDFTISIFSPEIENNSFIIKSLHFNRLDIPVDVDANGQVYSSELRETDNNAYQSTRSVGRYNGGALTNGTCWLLGKTNYLISNAHVIIPSISGDYSAASVDFLFDGPIGENRYRVKGANVLKLGTADTSTDHDNDYGIVALDKFDVKYSRMLDLVGGLALSTEDEDVLIGKTIYMPGHPAAKEQRTSYYSDTDTSQRCSLQETTKQQIKHNCYSAPGASGAPIIDADNRKTLGINWGKGDDDDEGIYRCVKGSHIWEGVKAFIDENDNVEVTGLAAQYATVARQAALVVDDDWKELVTFNESISFDGFTGNLIHYDTYSVFSGKALSNSLLEYIVDVNIKIAQETADRTYNLSTRITEYTNKNLIACIKKEDNPLLFSDESLYYRSWVSLRAVADTDTSSSYFIFEISAHN